MLLKSQVSFFKRIHSCGMREYLVWLVRLLDETKQNKIGTKKQIEATFIYTYNKIIPSNSNIPNA